MRFSRAAGILLILAGIVFWIVQRERRPRLDPPSLLAQVQQLNQLATVKYTVQKIVAMTEQKQPVGSESILLVMQASVHAGIDLAGMRSEDITMRGDGTVVLRLPSAKILSISIDEKETKV